MNNHETLVHKTILQQDHKIVVIEYAENGMRRESCISMAASDCITQHEFNMYTQT